MKVKSKMVLYRILWWILPILNHLFCIIMDWLVSVGNFNNMKCTPLYWNVCIIGNVRLIVWLYLYLWICSSCDFNKQAILIITVLTVFVQILVHLAIIAFVTTTTYDLYMNGETFPVGEFIYSLLYFIPFYIVAFVLRGKAISAK